MSTNDFMNFDPSTLAAFQSNEKPVDTGIYRTNPKLSKSEDGIYRSKVRIILNPLDPRDSIVKQTTYWLSGRGGNRLVKSALSNGDTSCPIFSKWKTYWYPEDETKRSFARKHFNRNESTWVLVQVIEDENQPEMVGKFRVMKLAKPIYEVLLAKMAPSTASKAVAYPVMDYVVGLELNMEVTPGPDDPKAPERKQREISYSLSAFGEYMPVIKTDGTPLFSDDEMELIDSYVQANKDSHSAKTQKKKDEAKALLEELRPQLKPLYDKAITYVKENAKFDDGSLIDLKNKCGFEPWDEGTTVFVNNWLSDLDNLFNGSFQAPTPVSTEAPKVEEFNGDDLPF